MKPLLAFALALTLLASCGGEKNTTQGQSGTDSTTNTTDTSATRTDTSGQR